jgi:phage gp37-like protein
MDLLLEQSIAQVEQALLDTITLALRHRASVSDLDALRARSTRGASGGPARSDRDLAYVASVANVYGWVQASTAGDDGDTVVAPLDGGATGRWVKAISPVRLAGVPIATLPTGYLKVVVLHNGDFSDDVLRARIYGQAPCVAIHFAGEDHTPLSQIPGALYGYTLRFELWSVSRNYREGPEAAIGSPIPSEAARDPSVMKIHGALKKLLAGQDLGQPGIKYIEIGAGRLEEADECERVFVMSLGIEVRGSIHNADAPAELMRPTAIDAQKSFASPGGAQRFDASNSVISGLDVPLGMGFTKTVTAGTALVADAPVNVPLFVATFAPGSDTYRDLLPDGAWVLATVRAGNAAPAIPPGAVRIGVTTTDAFGVVADRFIASVNALYADPDQVALQP